MAQITDRMVEAATHAFWESITPGTGGEYEPGDLVAMRAALEAAEDARVGTQTVHAPGPERVTEFPLAG